jgi:hypothetical protein
LPPLFSYLVWNSKGKKGAAPKWSFSNPFTGAAAVQAAENSQHPNPGGAAGSGGVAVVSGGVAYRIT